MGTGPHEKHMQISIGATEQRSKQVGAIKLARARGGWMIMRACMPRGRAGSGGGCLHLDNSVFVIWCS